MAKSAIHQKIEALDAKNDAWEIVRLSVFYEFPWDFNRALELALYKTFAVPSIAAILHNSKEFEKHPQKRYDDTDLILSEIIENGFNERGLQVIERLNWIHSNYKITNEDFLYVLSTFVFDSADWINKYGYRKLTRNEELAGFYIWKDIGEKMHIQDIPESIETFKKYHDDYEAEHFQFSEANIKVARATEDLMLGWYLPKFMFGIARPFLYAVMQPHLLKAFYYNEPGAFLRGLVTASLRFRSIVSSWFPRKTPYLRTRDFEHKAYPNGYTLNELGPEKLIKAPSCPFHKVTAVFK
ncbi:MAG: oxygenase MpaB family protein [Chitinophagales bacterium]